MHKLIKIRYTNFILNFKCIFWTNTTTVLSWEGGPLDLHFLTCVMVTGKMRFICFFCSYIWGYKMQQETMILAITYAPFPLSHGSILNVFLVQKLNTCLTANSHLPSPFLFQESWLPIEPSFHKSHTVLVFQQCMCSSLHKIHAAQSA